MEGYKRKDEIRPQLLDLIPKEREWLVNKDEERSYGFSEEKKLELRLGPPGEDWTMKNGITKNNPRETDESLLSLGYFSTSGSKRGFIDTVFDQNTINKNGGQTHKFSSSKAPFLQLQQTPQSLSIMAKESSLPCCTKVADLQTAENKTFSPASANTAVSNISQKRTAPAPVVGWPPIRSFRKNLASSSSTKPPPESQNVVPNKVGSEKQSEITQHSRKGWFVKINMDGVPIGRKVDLKAYDSYEKLSSAVDELFRGLLAAQRDSSTAGIQNNQGGEKAITGLLGGSGEYTLVYEDNEGDRMLVGDVPWHMFVSTVKRLRVLKSSEVSKLFLGSKQEKIPLDAGLK